MKIMETIPKMKDAVAKNISAARDQKIQPQLPKRQGRPTMPLVIGGVVGGLLAFFFDPQRGAARRNQLVERAGAALRTGNRKLTQLGRKVRADGYGFSKKLTHLQPTTEIVDDLTLKDRVESMIYRDPEIPKGKFNIDVVGGIVRLRGELDRSEQIRQIERAVRRIPGVLGVENWLHPAGTPSPTEATREVTISSRDGGY